MRDKIAAIILRKAPRYIITFIMLLAGGVIDISTNNPAASRRGLNSASAMPPFSLSNLVVGVPYEDIDTNVDAGLVNIIYGKAGIGLTSLNDRSLDQNVTGIESIPKRLNISGMPLPPGTSTEMGWQTWRSASRENTF